MDCYEVGEDVASQFENAFSIKGDNISILTKTIEDVISLIYGRQIKEFC